MAEEWGVHHRGHPASVRHGQAEQRDLQAAGPADEDHGEDPGAGHSDPGQGGGQDEARVREWCQQRSRDGQEGDAGVAVHQAAAEEPAAGAVQQEAAGLRLQR